MHTFTAQIDLIGINPFVAVPADILREIFQQAGTNKGAIPIRGTVNGKPYRQTLVKYLGQWRLYINATMLKNSPKRIGETVAVTVAYDPEPRVIEPHPKLTQALADNPEAKAVFDNLPPSTQKEIVRYISNLKTEATIDKNVDRAIGFLRGKGRFIGRELEVNDE